MSPARPSFSGRRTTPGTTPRTAPPADQAPGRGRAPGLLRASATMAAGTAVSRGLGFVRLLVLNIALGAYYQSANAFALANTIPNMLYMLLAGGMLNAVLVPQIVRATKRSDGGADYVNRLITWALVLLAIITVAATAAAPLIVRVYSDSDFGAWMTLATAFAFWCLPQVFFYGLYTVLGQVLNAHGRFGWYMWAPVVNNVVGIAGLGLFLLLYGPAGEPDAHPVSTWTPAMIAVLAATATLGVVVQAVVLIWPLRQLGMRYRPTFGIRGTGLGAASRVAMWTFAALLATQVALWVATRVATTVDTTARTAAMDVPGLNAMQIALLLFMLPHSLVAVSVVTALFTSMSSAAGAGALDQVRSQLSVGLRSVGFFSILGTAGLVALALPIAQVFTGPVAAAGLAWVIVARALGLVFFSATYLFQRLSYAFEDALTPFLAQLPGVVLVIAGSLASASLPAQWVVVGISAAWSAAALSNAAVSTLVLRRQYGALGLREVMVSHGRMLVAGLAAAVGGGATVLALAMVAGPGRGAAAGVCVVGGCVVVTVYLLTCRLVGVPELTGAMSLVRRRVSRSRR